MGILSYIKVIAALSLAVASAGPVPLERRGQVPVLACTGVRQQGTCTTFLVNTGSCSREGCLADLADYETVNVPDDFNDQISTIKNQDKDAGHCTWFIDSNCQGDTYGNQDDEDLADGNGKFDDSISSILCS